MAKSLKDILTGTKSSTKTKVDLKDWEKSKDGQKFAAKHTIEKHADRAGNGDDVYKGKTKEAKYDHQKDSVYEEVEQIDELSPTTMHSYIDAAKVDRDETNKHISNALFKKSHPDEKKNPGAVIKDVKLGLDLVANRSKGIRTAEAKLKGKAVVPANEEVEELDEISKEKAEKYGTTAMDSYFSGKNSEKTQTNRANGMYLARGKLGKNSASVKVSANEEAEQIDEISDKLAWSYTNKNLKEPTADPTTDAGFRKNQNRDKGLKLALDKQSYPKTSLNKAKVPTSDATNKEKKYQDAIKEEEQLDELSDKLKADYREKATADIKNKFDSAMDSERMGDSKTTNKLLKKIASRKVNIKKSMNESMKCESCGAMYEGESCGCGGKKKLLLGGKKSLKEVLTKKTPASEVISDFVHSKNKTFSGDSKKQRINRALGAYYGMHPEKSVKEEAAVEPMLEGGKKKVKK